MAKLNRRNFLKLAGGSTGLALTGCASSPTPKATKKAGPAKVVVVGGGFGGASAAKYLKKFDPSIQVTLIEYNKTFTTCPGSNWVLGGLRDIDSITHSYDSLINKYGINVIHDWVSAIDVDGKNVRLASGSKVEYDRLILSPGIDFRYDTIEGYTANDVNMVPHAWKAGSQTTVLRNQIASMRDGGVFVIAPPPNPFRCPPGPYERVSLIANYFKKHKPKSKILILDAKPKFSKQGLFIQGWKDLYGYGTDKSMIEFVAAPDGKVSKVDVKSKTAYAGPLEEAVKADVLNVVPAQKAGELAQAAGLTDKSGWCPVNHHTWESKVAPFVHVIGDSAIQAPLPKSGYAANSEAKICAAAVASMLAGKDPEPHVPSWVNTCYSLVGPQYGISVAMVYNLTKEGKVGKVKGSGGLTPMDGNRQLEALYAENWLLNISNDTWADG